MHSASCPPPPPPAIFITTPEKCSAMATLSPLSNLNLSFLLLLVALSRLTIPSHASNFFSNPAVLAPSPPLEHPPLHHPPAVPPSLHPAPHHHHPHPHHPHHAPATSPVHPPAGAPAGHHGGHHHHAHPPPPSHAPTPRPALPPVHPPAHPPIRPMERRFIGVQGVVYCKSCKYAGSDTLLGASPLLGAVVKLECNNTRYRPLMATAKTDKNGYFLLVAPKTITTYAFHKCRAFLVSSPLASCARPSPLHGGSTGAVLRPEKPFMYQNMPFMLFSVGPFAFEPQCPH